MMSSWLRGDVALRSSSPAYMPCAHDDDAVADADDLRQVGRDDEDRDAAVGEIVDDRIDLRLGADIDAARRLVEDQRPSAAVCKQARQQHLLLVAAGQRADA